jgi:hypothetical protein
MALCQNTIVFKGQLYHNKSGPLKKVRVVVNNQYPAMTDDAGIFAVTLPRSATNVRITVPLSNHHIIYPAGGYLAIPRDLKDIPQIIVGKRKENIFLTQYLTLYKQKRADSPNVFNNLQLSKKMDSLQTLLMKFHYTESEIKTAEKLLNGKEETISQLLQDLSAFRNSARDLAVTFKNLSPFAFEQSAAIDALLDAVKAYNNNYNKLDRMHNNYEQRIADFWQNDSLNKAFTELVDFNINHLHPEKIYPLQEVILQIRQYYTGKKKNRNTRTQLEEVIVKNVKQLQPALNELDMRTNKVLQQLDD